MPRRYPELPAGGLQPQSGIHRRAAEAHNAGRSPWVPQDRLERIHVYGAAAPEPGLLEAGYHLPEENIESGGSNSGRIEVDLENARSPGPSPQHPAAEAENKKDPEHDA